MKFPRISTLLLQGVVPAVLTVLVSYPAGVLAQTASSEHIVSSKALQQQVDRSRYADQTENDEEYVMDHPVMPSTPRSGW